MSINTNSAEMIKIAEMLEHLNYPDNMDRLKGWEIAAIDDTRNHAICRERHASRKTNCSHAKAWHSNKASYLKNRMDCVDLCDPVVYQGELAKNLNVGENEDENERKAKRSRTS